MRYAVTPLQKELFDPAKMMFSPMAIKYLEQDWPGLFRNQILHLMPVGKLAENFHPSLGCPTKELYSMAGVIFLKEFFNLTIAETVQRCLLDSAWHYSLNIVPHEASMSHASIERYTKLFAENDIASELFHRVTSALIEALELDLSRQRLDSTHIHSDMATFGRSKLMGVTIKRFLIQLKRNHLDDYYQLPEELRNRYSTSQAKLFGDFTGSRKQLRQTVAEGLLFLVNRFADNRGVSNYTCYKAMERVLHEQCEVDEARTVVEVKTKTGGNVMQNPSDPDATYDGHKGPGYQIQIAETCGDANDQQLISGVEVEPAHCADADALVPMLDQLDEHDRLPEQISADTLYGSDDNAVEAEQRGVDLQSPVNGSYSMNTDDLTIDDFVVDEQTEIVECCPCGRKPKSSNYNTKTGETKTVMRLSDCDNCSFCKQCPVKKTSQGYVICHTPTQRRLFARRAEQQTKEFKENYSIRAGSESVNSGLKRSTGIGRLRTRGLPRIRMAVMMRCAGWNLIRALAMLKKRGIVDYASLKAMSARLYPGFCSALTICNRRKAAVRGFGAFLQRKSRRCDMQHIPVAA